MADSRFVYVTYIRCSAEQLWRALLEPEFTRKYWNETWQESDWEPGASWRLMVPDGRVGNSGEIVEIVEFKKLVLTWRVEFVAEMREEGYSRLTYELEQQGDMVRLMLTQEMERHESKVIVAVSNGWPIILASLKSLIETGEALDATRKWPKEY